MRWEYKAVNVKVARKFLTSEISAEAFEEQLNALGRDGWELVAVNPNQMHCVLAIFKRSK